MLRDRVHGVYWSLVSVKIGAISVGFTGRTCSISVASLSVRVRVRDRVT